MLIRVVEPKIKIFCHRTALLRSARHRRHPRFDGVGALGLTMRVTVATGSERN